MYVWPDDGAETVGIIYDESAGLGIYLDYALAQGGFADPDPHAPPGLSWEHDGERLLRQFKPTWYERPVLPRVSVISDRLAATLRP